MRIVSVFNCIILCLILIHPATGYSQEQVGSATQELSPPASNDASNPQNDAVAFFNCSGTLVSSDLIITAPHCFERNLGTHVGGILPQRGSSSIWNDSDPVWANMAFSNNSFKADPCCVSGLRGRTRRINMDIPGWDIPPSPLSVGITNSGACQAACTGNSQCQAWTYVRPRNGAAAACWLKEAKVTVRMGGNNVSSLSVLRTARSYSMPGNEDIALIRLNRAVPSDVAIPSRVLTRIPGRQPLFTSIQNRRLSAWFGNQAYVLSGWGGGRTIRQTSTASFRQFPLRGRPNLLDLRGAGGATVEPGDSGGPAFANLNVGRDRIGVRRYLIGVAQGVESQGGRYHTTLGVGGFDSNNNQRPNISSWLDMALYENEYSVDAALVPLYSWWNSERKDNFISTDPRWSTRPRGLLFSNLHIRNQKTKEGYSMYRLEGMVFNPRLPAPEGTVPLYSWWNSERKDNLASTNPRYSIRSEDVRWRGEHISNGNSVEGYTIYRLEGFVYSPRLPQPANTVPLYSWWNRSRTDNFTTTDPRWSINPGDVDWRGEQLSNQVNKEGYRLYRLEGYVQNPVDMLAQ